MTENLSPWAAVAGSLGLLFLLLLVFLAVLLRQARVTSVTFGIPFFRVVANFRPQSQLEFSNEVRLRVTEIETLTAEFVADRLWGALPDSRQARMYVRLAQADSSLRDALKKLRKPFPDFWLYSAGATDAAIKSTYYSGWKPVGLSRVVLKGEVEIKNYGDVPEIVYPKPESVSQIPADVIGHVSWTIRVSVSAEPLIVSDVARLPLDVEIYPEVPERTQDRKTDLDVLTAGQGLVALLRQPIAGIPLELWEGSVLTKKDLTARIVDLETAFQVEALDAEDLRRQWAAICEAVGKELESRGLEMAPIPVDEKGKERFKGDNG